MPGTWPTGSLRPSASSGSAKQAATYTCPMHPQYTSDHPGDCPICGMRLEPVAAGGARAKSASAGLDTPGMVVVGAARQQLIGVRTDEVRRELLLPRAAGARPHRGGRPAALPDRRRGRWLDRRPRAEHRRPLRQEGPAARVLLHARPPGHRAAVPAEHPRERTAADADEGLQPGVHTDGGERQPAVPDRLAARPGHERPADRGDPPDPHGLAPRQHLLAGLRFRAGAEHLAAAAVRQGHGAVSHRRHQPRVGDDRHLREGPRSS